MNEEEKVRSKNDKRKIVMEKRENMTPEEKEIICAVDWERKQIARSRMDEEEYESYQDKHCKYSRVSRFLTFERWLEKCESTAKKLQNDRQNESEEDIRAWGLSPSSTSSRKDNGFEIQFASRKSKVNDVAEPTSRMSTKGNLG